MSQSSQIKSYLESGKTLTPIEALEKFGCLRLAARIKDLRNTGLKIVDISKQNYSIYKLER